MPYLTAAEVNSLAGGGLDPIVLGMVLPAAEEMVDKLTGRRWGATSTVDVFTNVPEDALLPLSMYAPTTVEVRVYQNGDSAYSVLRAGEDYRLLPGGRVQLIPTKVASTPYGAAVKTFLDYFPKVEIVSQGDGSVPPAVRLAAALIAINLASSPNNLASNIVSEDIGEYSYTMELSTPKAALRLLAPYRAKVVAVT